MQPTSPSPTATQAEPLVSPDWLAQRLPDPAFLVLDIRSSVDGGGRAAFEAGHIRGSVHTDYVEDGWRVAQGPVPGLLPGEADLAALLGGIGLDPERHAVVVPAGTSAGDFGAAARVYWTLKAAGHARTSILDGGVKAWREDPARPVDSGPSPEPHPALPYPVRIDEALRARVGEVEQAIASGAAAFVDARTAAQFDGHEKSAQALRPGRLPGAVHVDQSAGFDAVAGRLRPAGALEALYAAVPDGPAVAYCNTGHQAATSWFVLSELLGRSSVSLYDGSMSEWSQDPTRPMASGPDDRRG